MIFRIAAARPLTITDDNYDRTFALEPDRMIFDPYLIDLIRRKRIRLIPISR